MTYLMGKEIFNFQSIFLQLLLSIKKKCLFPVKSYCFETL